MRFREFMREDNAPTTVAASPTDQTDDTVDTNADGTPNDPSEVGELTAAVSSLKKQIQDLQKSALQTSQSGTVVQQKPNTPPKPGEAGQPQAMKGAVAPGQQVANPNAPAKPGQPMGQNPVAPTANGNVSRPAPVPGVNQSPLITNMKIRQQLAQNQGNGS